MARYIDADKLIADGWHLERHAPNGRCLTMMSIADVPTADVAEANHGEWIYHECVSSYEGAISGYSCSVCSAFVNEEVFESDEFHKEYCGNCGAKMDGKKEGLKV